MKASTVRKLAKAHSVAELEAAAEAIAEREVDELGVDGEDLGEKLTHVMLAIRVRTRMEAGASLSDAFREQIASVRDLLTNE
ncbi:MAG: hypothetical protein ACI8PZ_002621 [Myxococcota bacterium]